MNINKFFGLAIIIFLSIIIVSGCGYISDLIKSEMDHDRMLKMREKEENLELKMREKQLKLLSKYQKAQCESKAFVGIRKEIEGSLKATRKNLDELSLTAGGKKYEELSQELEGYSATWESLRSSTLNACRDYTECKFYAKTKANEKCVDLRNRYYETDSNVRDLLVNILDLKKQSSEAQ
jgi:hypothetical protein